jgi:transposase
MPIKSRKIKMLSIFFLTLVRPYYILSLMAHIHKKMKKGRPYYYIREIARVDGKPKVIKQIYLGSIERIIELAQGGGEKCLKVSVEEFGALFLANLMEERAGLASLVDSVVPRAQQEDGPSVGEYFLYAVFNRMIDSCSKRALPEWFRATAIQQIRSVDISELTSQRYWGKWDRVSKEHIGTIGSLFFKKIIDLENVSADCFLFDTTNYYTYMASDTESELAQRGKNKEGENWLRQIGVALLVSRDAQLPLFYREYEGNRHDSKQFKKIFTEMISRMKESSGKDGELTLVFDKGMNSEDNIALIDSTPKVHFITTYSCYFAQDLLRVKLSEFKPVDTVKNRELARLGKEDDRLVAWRTRGPFWEKERTVIVTYNPRTAAKQRYAFDKKLTSLQESILDLKEKVKTQKPHWTDPDLIEAHYAEACRRLYLPKDLYEISLEKTKRKWQLLARKNHYRIGLYIEKFGKNILVTDQSDWSTDEIVRASLDRHMVENAFRQSKDDDLVGVLPIRHWTDGKIRCHILTCVAALTYLRLIELKLHRASLSITAQTAMEQMRKLHSCLCWTTSKRGAHRIIEDPTEMQAKILGAFGYKIDGGVLQKIQE